MSMFSQQIGADLGLEEWDLFFFCFFYKNANPYQEEHATLFKLL